MVYATADDISARLGRVLEPTAEIPKVNALITDISALVDTYCRRSTPFPVPVNPTIKAVVCFEVIRAMSANPAIAAEQAGDIHYTYTSGTGTLSRASMTVLNNGGFRRRFASAKMEGSTFDIQPPY